MCPMMMTKKTNVQGKKEYSLYLKMILLEETASSLTKGAQETVGRPKTLVYRAVTVTNDYIYFVLLLFRRKLITVELWFFIFGLLSATLRGGPSS